MPRVGGGGGRGFGGRSTRSAPHSYSPVPQPVHQTPPPALFESSFHGSGFRSFATTFAGIMVWCAGAVFAIRTVDSLWGPRTIKVQTVESEKAKPSASTSNGDACGMQLKAFQDCLKSCCGEISKCQFYKGMLAECKKTPVLRRVFECFTT